MPLIDLPVEIKMSEIDFKGLYQTQKNADTLYFWPGTKVFALLSDTSALYHFLTIAQDSDLPAVIYTSFSKQGRKIKSQRLAVDHCKATNDCGSSCEDWFRMDTGLVYRSWAITSQIPCEDGIQVEDALAQIDTVEVKGKM